MKKVSCIKKGVLVCFCIFYCFVLKYDLVEANQIYEASDFLIGNTVTNTNPEYMNYYKLNLLERKTIEVTCIGYSKEEDIFRLYLYNADFEEMDCDNPYGIRITNGAKKESKKYTLDPGIYYLAVNDNNSNMIKYELSINYIKEDILWNYYGNTFNNAKNIVAGEKLSGFVRGMYYSKAEQFYKTIIDKKTLLSLNFNYDKSGDVLTVELFDSSRNSIGNYSVISKDASSKKIQKTLNSGTYYIKISYEYNTNDGVDFGFILNGTADESDDSISKKAKVGTEFNYKKGRYKVLNASEVSYQGITSGKTKKVQIPQMVIFGNKHFKVTKIADKALKNTKITSVVIGSQVKSIGKFSMEGCRELKQVVIGKNVSKIGKKAFANCKKLKTITIYTSKLKSKNIGSNAFKGIYARARVEVPEGKVKEYKKMLKSKGAGTKIKVVEK